jgi:lysophospholipase L1-like esterase
MKLKLSLLVAVLLVAAQFNSFAQTNAPAAPEIHANTALIPEKHVTKRTDEMLQRAKDAPGQYDIEFIGDSITQGWENQPPKGGKNVWHEFYGKRKCINFGVSGDRTQHVLWRFEHGQLDGIKAKVAVVMIGTNNSGKGRNTPDDILPGVIAVVDQIRSRQPDTKIILCAIFPRGKAFNDQRGDILQVNQALARLDDGKNIFYLDFGSQFIENDGSIAPSMMYDALHPGEKGYEVWAKAIEPKLKELLGEK